MCSFPSTSWGYLISSQCCTTTVHLVLSLLPICSMLKCTPLGIAIPPSPHPPETISLLCLCELPAVDISREGTLFCSNPKPLTLQARDQFSKHRAETLYLSMPTLTAQPATCCHSTLSSLTDHFPASHLRLTRLLPQWAKHLLLLSRWPRKSNDVTLLLWGCKGSESTWCWF